jgi:O-acetylhomoserine (thiol)-lyase
MSNNFSFETLQIHAGQIPDPTTGARALPLYQTTAYQFRDTEHAANLFSLAELGNIYTRIMNPTQDAVEQRIAALEGGVASLLVASGSAATTFAILKCGRSWRSYCFEHHSLYGGTYNLFHYTLPKFGVEVTFVEDPSDPESWRKAVKPNTKAFFGETIANPKNEILDIKTVADVAHEVGVPLIVDNTVATPYLIKPIEFGADVVVHSATKFLSGHGNAVVGAIVDAGTFDYAKYPAKFKGFNEPDPSYNGIVYAQALGVGSAFGANLAYIFKIRLQLLRDVGAAVAPFNAWLLAQGLETLSLRIERHVENAKAIATWLEAHPSVSKVNYASLASSPWNKLSAKYALKVQVRCFHLN